MKKSIVFLVLLLVLSSSIFAADYDQVQKIVASDRAIGDRYGRAVCIWGDYLIVGAYFEDDDADGNNPLAEAGSAYIYKYNGSTWVQEAKLVSNDRDANDDFGRTVSISGDYAIVGALQEYHDLNDSNPLEYAGSAYIFKRDGSSWTQEAKIVASDRSTRDFFGNSVSISGDYAIIGAYQEAHDQNGDNPKNYAGSAYIFKRDGVTWTEEAKIVSLDRESSDRFAGAVCMSGDYVVVGAYYEDDDANGSFNLNYAGSAYIFKRDGTTWSQEAKLVASDRETEDYFGTSVSISGDYVIIGANKEDDDVDGNNPLTNAGAAYVFKRSGSIWTQEAKLVASDRAQEDYFGACVSIVGDYAIVGADYENGQAGAAYIFKRDGSNWTEQSKLVATDGVSGDRFGFSVGISDEIAVVGTIFEQDDADGSNPLSEAGSAYIFELPAEAATPITLESFTASLSQATVTLSWTTESESNNAAFLLYRNDELLSRIEGAGTSTETQIYSYIDEHVIPGVCYQYMLADLDFANVIRYHKDKVISISLNTDVEEPDFVIGKAYPNPFNPCIRLNLQYEVGSNTIVNVYNTQGILIDQLYNSYLEAGKHELVWDASERSSGIYLLQLITGDMVNVQKISLMK